MFTRLWKFSSEALFIFTQNRKTTDDSLNTPKKNLVTEHHFSVIFRFSEVFVCLQFLPDFSYLSPSYDELSYSCP